MIADTLADVSEEILVFNELSPLTLAVASADTAFALSTTSVESKAAIETSPFSLATSSFDTLVVKEPSAFALAVASLPIAVANEPSAEIESAST